MPSLPTHAAAANGPLSERPPISDPCALPPGFEIVPGPAGHDAFAAAMADAEAGGDPGRVHWDDGDGRCTAAVVLAPDRPVTAEVVGHLALLALFDALATLAPPQVPVDLVLPGTVLVDGGRVGGVRTALGPRSRQGALPGWAVAGFAVALRSDAADPGYTPGETCLLEEGFADVTAAEVLGHFCRHLLVWVDAWQEEGAPALARAVGQRVRPPEHQRVRVSP